MDSLLTFISLIQEAEEFYLVTCKVGMVNCLFGIFCTFREIYDLSHYFGFNGK